MKKRFVMVPLVLAGLSGGVQAEGITVDWTWLKSHYCNNTSPEFVISNIPAGTKVLRFKMNDLDFQNKDHGGGSVEFAGADGKMVVSAGALTEYEGPCPRADYSRWGHDYLISVKAMSADGAELASGGKKQNFSANTAK